MGRWLIPAVLALGALAALGAATRLVGLVPVPWPATPVAGSSRPHLVVIAQEYANPYWEQVRTGAEAAARQHGALLEFVGPERWTLFAHTRLLDMAIAARPDGILVQGLSEAEFTPLIDKAMRRGIPVITIDTDSPSERLAYVGTDNYQSGVRAGRLLVQALNGRGTVGIITGSLRAANQVERVQGIRDAIRLYPNLQEVAIAESNISLIGASEAAAGILELHPDVSALVGTSALDGPGAARAVAAMGRGDVLVIGWDNVPETQALLQSGALYAAVVQNPYEMGFRGVELMLDHLAGRPIPERVDTGVSVLPESAAAGGGGQR